MMENVFLHLLNMSLTAGLLVVAVVLLRLVFHRAPRWIHCLLWALVAVRLLCPISIESTLSLMPDTEAALSAVQEAVTDTPATTPPVTDIPVVDTPATDTPVGGTVSTPVVTPTPDTPSTPDTSPSVSATETETDPWQTVVTVSTYVWLGGVVLLAAYAVATTLRLRRQVAEAARLSDRVWCCDHLRSPFILGVFRPRIYLPSDLSASVQVSVLAHEQAHLHRRDHWWKPLGFVLLMVYWFNPLMWVAYVLLCRDIEAACDERVVRDMTVAERKAYSEALLSCSAPRRLVSACPLAFGETSVGSRIKSVLSYKKPAIWIIVAALLISTVAGVCLLTDRPADKPDSDDSPSLTDKDDDPDPDDTPQYAFFTHKDKPHAQVTLEIGGNSCTYTNSIASSWLALGTYTMDGDTVTLNFPDDAMTLVFKGDLIGLTLRIGNGGSRMSYEQMSFGDDTLKNGAVFERQEETRAVSFDASVTFAGGQVRLTDEQRTALYERYSYRTGSYSDKDRPVIPITSRAELEAFTGEYIAESKADLVSGYDDAFFADKMLFAVYHRDGSGSVQPKIEAIDYNSTELVTVQVDVYEPTWCDTSIGQWFMLVEVPRSEIKGATAYRAVVRNRIPTDNYWITYSHPIVVGSEDEPTKSYHRLGDSTDSFRQRLDGLTWYGADTMADTAFTALGHFSFDGKKQYYVSPDKKQLYDGEQIADLTAEQSEQLDYYLREGNPGEDAATASVTGTVTEWNKEGGYLMLEVTEGDSKLGPKVMVYTGILPPGSAPAVGYPATIYYDGWYDGRGYGSAIYAIHRQWQDADLLGGPDDEPTNSTTTTTPPTTTTTTTNTTTTTTTTAMPTQPTIPTSAEVGDVLVLGGLGMWNDGLLGEVYGGESVRVFRSYAELDAFLNQYAVNDRYLKREDFAQFTPDWFSENALLMTYYVDGSCSVHPTVGAYSYNEDGTVLSVGIDVYEPLMQNDAMGGWHMFSGIKKADLVGVTELTKYVRAEIPEGYYIALFTEPTYNPQSAEEKWRKWLPDREGWDLERLVWQWNNADLFVKGTRACEYVAAFRISGHVHYVSKDFAALQRDDGKLYWLTEYDANLIKRIIAIYEENP